VKIVHFIKWLRLRDGGTVRAVLDMCAGLAHAGHQVTAVSTDDSGVPPLWKGEEMEGVPRNVLLRLCDPLFERGGRNISEATRDTPTQYLPSDSLARARVALTGADVLHVHGIWANVNLQMIALARRMKIPYVISPHGMLDDWSMSQGALKKRIHLTLCSRRYLGGARAVHCTASAEADQAKKHFTPGPQSLGTVVVPLLFDTAPFTALPGPGPARARWPQLSQPGHHVLFLSRLNHKKGVITLLEALRVACAKGKPFHLWLAGPADPPEYQGTVEAIIKQHNLSSLVHLIGMVGGEHKWSLYQAADLFVLPTSQENFGYVLLEALACGTPVVTTKGVDIWPELASSGGATILNNPTEPIHLEAAVTKLLSDPARRDAMTATARAWAMQFLDRDRTIKAMEAMYSRTRAPLI
jgi:glycosyltransferase involved in cell wall biosynthesis